MKVFERVGSHGVELSKTLDQIGKVRRILAVSSSDISAIDFGGIGKL